MNTIVLLGRTTSTIELKQTQQGKSVATFSLAVKRPYTKDTTDFHTICCWGRQAELVSSYVNKGDQVCIRGYLTTRTWTDNQGNKRYSTEVIGDEVSFVGGNASSAEAKSEPYAPSAYTSNSQNFEEITTDGDLPF
jgi:single-strand DNA-binding protein